MLRMFRGPHVREAARIEAFSDGVIAIAITLLVLDVHVPALASADGGPTLWRRLADLWPNYVGYALSFAVIGIIWANHHTIFRFIGHVNHQLVVLNTVFLFFVSFIPFPTALLAEYLGHRGERTAVIVYSGWLFAMALSYNVLWWYARWAALVDMERDPASVASISRRFRLGPPSYGLAFGLAFVLPVVALLIQAALAILYVLPQSTGAHEAT